MRNFMQNLTVHNHKSFNVARMAPQLTITRSLMIKQDKNDRRKIKWRKKKALKMQHSVQYKSKKNGGREEETRNSKRQE